MSSSKNARCGNFRRRRGSTDMAAPRCHERGSVETEYSRPSSSGGRLEQHLGPVELVDKRSVADIIPPSPIIPRGVGFPDGSQVTNVSAIQSQLGGGGAEGSGRAEDKERIYEYLDNPCPPNVCSGTGSAYFSIRAVDDDPSLRRISDVEPVATGRRARGRKGGGKRRSVDFVVGQFVGTNADNMSKAGLRRPKGDRVKTKSRRTAPQVSFVSAAAEGNGGNVGTGCRNPKVGYGGGVTEDKTEDHKFRMQAGQSNTLVAVRLRPLLKHERDLVEVVKVLDNRVIVLMDPAKLSNDVDPLRVNRTREKRYAFDYVFDAKVTQRAVYENTTKFLIQGVLDGFNATVFAYGCTGAGKTYTMIGNGQREHQGIMVLTLEDLFKQQRRSSEAQGRQYSVNVSFLEVYNESIRDLLSDTGDFLDLREDPIKGPTVSGLAEVEAQTPEEIMELLHQGNLCRTQQATRANAVSSRSHAVLQVVVESRDKAPGTVATMHIGKLSLVDLAGSERAAATRNRGVRLVEGANINRSLLALGNCINALGERSHKGQFVPYRDSKLTRLLKDSLGGNCRTVMIANICAAATSFEETLNTLKYANRAKNIKTNATRNSLDVNYHISEYVNLIGSLRSEITRLKHQLVRGGRAGVGIEGIRPERHMHSLLTEGLEIGGKWSGRAYRSGATGEMTTGPSMPAGNVTRSVGFETGADGLDVTACSTFAADTAEPSSAEGRDFVEQASEAVSEGNGPIPQQEENGSGQPTLAGEFRKIREKLDEFHDEMTGLFEQLAARQEQDARQRRNVMEADETNIETSERTESTAIVVRGKIVENFRERMQLRRSLVELEDQNVQNSIEIGKRQLLLVEWHGGRELPREAANDALQGLVGNGGWAKAVAAAAEATMRGVGESTIGEDTPPPPPDVRVAWRECEQLTSAISKNNETKRKISKRLKNNGRQAERLKSDLDGKITGEDRNQLMKLQYRIGKLELDNMELEQSRIVHESAMRGKDLTIQKLQLQVAVRDRTIALQQSVLKNQGTETSAGCPHAADLDQVGVADALDAFLSEEGYDVNSNVTRRGTGDNMETSHDDTKSNRNRRGRPRARGRRDGWGSPSYDDHDADTMKLVEADSDSGVALIDSSDGDGDVCTDRGESSIADGMRAAQSTTMAKLSTTATENGYHHRRGRTKKMFEKTDEAEGGGESTAEARWPRPFPSERAARTRSNQPPSSKVQRKFQEARPRRRRFPRNAAAGAAVDNHQGPGDCEDESVDDGLVVSSIPYECVERNCTRVAPASEAPEGILTSVVVAPFHGPTPTSLAFEGGSTANITTPSLDPTASDAEVGWTNDSFLDNAAVVGVSVKRQASKGFHQRPRQAGGNHYQHYQQRRPLRNAPPVTVTNDVSTDVPSTTWDDVAGSLGKDLYREGAGESCEGPGYDKDSFVSTGTNGVGAAVSYSEVGERVVDGRRGCGSFRHPPDQEHLVSKQEPTTTEVVKRRNHHARVAAPLSEADALASVPLRSATYAGGDMAAAQVAKIPPYRTRAAVGNNDMGVSGTGVVSLALRDRQEGSKIALVASTGVGRGAGVARRRIRREQSHAILCPEAST